MSSIIAAIEPHVLIPGDAHSGLWLGPNLLLEPGASPRCHHVFVSESDRRGGDSIQHEFDFLPTSPVPPACGVETWWESWLERELPPHLDRQIDDDGYEFVPSLGWGWHRKTQTGLGIGGVVRHRDGKLDDHVRHLAIAYATYRPEDQAFAPWSSFQLELDGEPKPSISPCQALELPDGDVLLPFSVVKEFAGWDSVHWVGTARCTFDGEELTPIAIGNLQTNPVPRGFVEPSVGAWNGGFLLTLRAQDGHGHIATSEDGLQWSVPEPWRWDDGTPIPMEQTMTKFLAHSDGLFLVYTRIGPEGKDVFRYRAPVYVAQIDPLRRVLIRATEQVVFPSRGFPMGNFRVYTVSPEESWITVPEWDRTGRDVACDMLLARIRWTSPNRIFADGPFPLGG